MSGNVVDHGEMSLAFTGDDINGFLYYNLTFDFSTAASGLSDTPELVVGFEKTQPPAYQLYV